jgi:hypothetical protein
VQGVDREAEIIGRLARAQPPVLGRRRRRQMRREASRELAQIVGRELSRAPLIYALLMCARVTKALEAPSP